MALPFAPPATADFHMHTDASDGEHPAAEMAAAAARARLYRWAITDHDTLEGWRKVRTAPGLVCGVEVTAGDSGREIHIVGLGVDPEHAGLRELLAGIRSIRMQRVDAILQRMPSDVRRGLTAEQVKPAEADAVGRLHLAKALARCGGVASVRDAFQQHLADEHITDTGLPPFPPIEVVAHAIHAAGGVSILAHPGAYRSILAIAPLTDHLDGIEGAHPGLPDDLQREILELAQLRGLLVSLGSDTHRISATRRPGGVHIEQGLLDPLLDRLRR
ncbi:MAG: PHP domain-containing protein [Planctomycetes bacterium]|nr:PHP domain-containing protein [Planctomycetota bacterium]